MFCLKCLSSSGISEVDTKDDGGNTWIAIPEYAHSSSTDASITAGKSTKELIDTIRFHSQELFGNHQALEKVVVPLGGTLIGTAMAWFCNADISKEAPQVCISKSYHETLGRFR
jgi:mechanosensitive ion channel protein 1/2/3